MLSCSGLAGCHFSSNEPGPDQSCDLPIGAGFVYDRRDAGTSPTDEGPACTELNPLMVPDSGTVLGHDECVSFCGENGDALRPCRQLTCRTDPTNAGTDPGTGPGRKLHVVACFKHLFCL